MSYIWNHRNQVKKRNIEKSKFPFSKLTKEHLALIKFRKDHESGKATELYLIWHSVVTAISFAFFVGLFSAGTSYEHSKLLIASSTCFAISLTMNASFSLFYQVVNNTYYDDGNFLFKIHLVKKFEYVRSIAMLSPMLGTVLLVLYFSLLASLLSFIFFALTAFIIYKTFKSYIPRLESDIEQQKRETLDKGDFENHDLLERLYGD
ncbi:hypothetical protein [Pantoea anthophila]|uniref:hypothetical protein n=1 Tax=Pantoea anthophila TaxID=470931 RepID=UPI003CEAA81F